jgi:hypothetical protein
MAEQLKQFLVHCEGGLDLTQSVLMRDPGVATALINYEAGITGGYKRVAGYSKYSTTAVTGQGTVLGVFVYNAGVVAVRPTVADATKSDVYYGTGTSWTKINTDVRVTPTTVQCVRYNWTGTERMVMADGVNYGAKWDGTTWTVLNSAGAPAAPKIVAEHRGYIVFAGYTGNKGAIALSSVLAENDWVTDPTEIVVGDEVVALHSWRDVLIIFCKRSIYKLTGLTSTDFTVIPVSKNVGCVSQMSVREVGGDLYFLSADGIRTISGTDKIDDFELGTVSHTINTRVSGINASTYNISTCTVRTKNQYRLFYVAATDTDLSAKGLIGCMRKSRQGQFQWEWGELLGIRAYSADSAYISTQEYVVHGGYDGFVYRQETGTAFGSNAISYAYKTVDFPLDDGDTGLRKCVHRIILYTFSEGTASLGINVLYDQNDPNKQQPALYTISNIGGVQYVFDAIASTYDGTTVYDQTSAPIYRQPVGGSGMTVALQFSGSSSSDAAHTIIGFAIEYTLYGRR